MTQPPQPPSPPGAQHIQVELTDDVAQGTYSNLIFITHSPSEFILDFARALPGTRKGKVYSRVVMTPQHAKALAQLLERNLDNYEEKHGIIKIPGKNADDPKIGFTPSPAAPSEGTVSEQT